MDRTTAGRIVPAGHFDREIVCVRAAIGGEVQGMGFLEEEFARTPGGVEIVPTIEAECTIRERGGLLFVWPKISRGLLGTMTLLRTSTAVPVDALEYRRFQVGRILVFLSPRIRRLPKRLDLDARGRHGRIKAYWDSCEFA